MDTQLIVNASENNRLSFVDVTLLLIFLMTFELSATIFALSMNDILRWIVCIVLVIVDIIYAVLLNNGYFRLLPKEFAFLIFPLFIQSFWNIEQTAVALLRSGSFVIYCMAISSLFHRPYMNSHKIKKIFSIFFIVNIAIILPLNLLSLNNFSEAGDYLGIYSNRNMTISVLLCIFVILGMLLQFHKGSRRIEKIVYVFLLILDMYLIFITHSRMAIIGTACGLGLMVFLYSERKNIIRNVIIIGALAVFVLMIPTIGQRFDITAINRLFAYSSVDGSTGFLRWNVWDYALDLFKQKPLFGWGNNSVYYNTFVHHIFGWGVHNSYFVMLVEGGVTGTFCYLLFFLASIRIMIKDYKDCLTKGMDSESKVLVRFFAIMCIVLAINGVSESFLFSAGNVMSLPFWLCFIGARLFLHQKRKELS